MKHSTTLASMIALALPGLVGAQLVVLHDNAWATSVNNNGEVVVRMAGSTTWTIWDPDQWTFEPIGGIGGSNDYGAGSSRAYFSANGQQLCGTIAGTQGYELASYDRSTGNWTGHG